MSGLGAADEHARIHGARLAARAWLQEKCPVATITLGRRLPGRRVYEFYVHEGDRLLHIVQLGEDFLRDYHAEIGWALEERGLWQQLSEVGLGPVRITG